MLTGQRATKTDLTVTEAAVLGLLVERAASGYDLAKQAQRSVGYIWAPAKGHIYAVLPRLVAQGLATRRTVREGQRPEKQLYRVTPKGERALRAWLESDEPTELEPFLLKVFFGRHLPPERLAAHVERHRDRAAALLEEYRAIERDIRDRHDRYWAYLTLRLGIARARASIRWADEVLRELRAAER